MFKKPTDWPSTRPSCQSIFAQFGQDRMMLINWALNTGDPLADALVSEMHDIGMKKGHEQFRLAAKEGLRAVSDPTPALISFFTEVEEIANQTDDYLLEEACLPFFTIPRYIHTISLSAGGLLRVYSSPSIAYVLTATGRLNIGAERRLVETSKWLYTATLPGSLRRGNAGYVDTLYVRLLHAHMRNVAREKGFDESKEGVAINQIDLARTWIDFTFTSYTVFGYVRL
ncbi:hypothetical protein [Alkalihalobacillus sp. 1P02AB]|uniref:hypothetical protein n=1 Tax=Alkalihalobacillus sp. 1P02AB TaxID=3132260 RepID=UPI0039A6C20B